MNQFFISNALAEQDKVKIEGNSSNIGILQRFFRIIGKFTTFLFPIFRLAIVAVASEPPFIEIGYNETVNIELGMIDPETGEFEVWDRDYAIFTTRYVNFEVVEYPGGTDSTSWFIDYNPTTVVVKKGSVLKTNVTISLTSPPIASNAIQSGLLKFRVADTWGYGDLWFPPKGSPMDKPIYRFLWFFSAMFIIRFGKYSGTVDVEYKDIAVLVKVKPYHALKFDTMPLINLKPDQITSIPITLENLGNYNDTFNFRVFSDNGDIILINPSSVTLAPGEQKDIYLGISIPQSVFDYGTLHSIKIEAYSVYDPNVTIDQKTIYIETRGVYISEIGGIGIIFLVIFLLAFISIYLHRRRLFFEKYCVKPDKPWEIPEEKAYLDEIKTDEKKYNETLKMMHDEYKSALLWYKSYIDATIKKIKEEKNEKKIKEKAEKLKTKKEQKKKIIPKIFELKKKDLHLIKKEEIPIFKKKKLPVFKKKEAPVIKKKEEKPTYDLEAELEKRRKEKVIQKIKRDQEQQIKKLSRGD